MASIIKQLTDEHIVKDIPSYAKDTQYEVIMGSYACGVSNDLSDTDVYGFCIPHKEMIFPHITGFIKGFDENTAEHFEQWTETHIRNKDRMYDFQIYNIVKYFKLTMDCNPNMIDSLFVGSNCILHATKIGNMVRDKRHLFLSKKAWHRFKGYAYDQLHNAENKAFVRLIKFIECNFSDKISVDSLTKEFFYSEEFDVLVLNHSKYVDIRHEYIILKDKLKKTDWHSNRVLNIKKFGWDVKFGYHVVRLIDEVKQILAEGDIDLTRNKAQMKAVRAGEMSLEEVKSWFRDQEKNLEKLYAESNIIPYVPRTAEIKELLMNCLEERFGAISKVITREDINASVYSDIKSMQTILSKY